MELIPRMSRNDWVLVLRPNECVGEDLEASLFEWREASLQPAPWDTTSGFVSRMAESGSFIEPEMRLANRKQINWTGDLPPVGPQRARFAGAHHANQGQRVSNLQS